MTSKKVETKKISIDCPVDLLERIDKLAEFGDLPRQRLMTNMIEAGADYLEATKKVGILHIALLFRDLGECLKQHAEKMKKTEIKGLYTPIK